MCIDLLVRKKNARLTRPIAKKRLLNYLLSIEEEVEAAELTKKQKEQLVRFTDETELYGIPKNLEIKDLGEIGKGVFLKNNASPIRKGSLVGVYTGHYIFYTEEKSELDFRYLFGVHGPVKLSKEEKAIHFPDNRDPHSLLKITKKDEIHIGCNALKAGNFTRLINQGGKNHINCEAYCVWVGGRKEQKQVLIGVFSSRSIRPGDQLFLDYGEEYWEELGIEPLDLNNRRKKS